MRRLVSNGQAHSLSETTLNNSKLCYIMLKLKSTYRISFCNYSAWSSVILMEWRPSRLRGIHTHYDLQGGRLTDNLKLEMIGDV